jgi:uncharacterized membrane protein
MRFIVMGNIFNAEVPIHQQYDLKGSTQGRFVKNKAKALIWKDLDLDVELQLSDGWKDRLDRQLTADASFLEQQRVMDYSLLMGIHYKNREQVRLGTGSQCTRNCDCPLLCVAARYLPCTGMSLTHLAAFILACVLLMLLLYSSAQYHLESSHFCAGYSTRRCRRQSCAGADRGQTPVHAEDRELELTRLKGQGHHLHCPYAAST